MERNLESFLLICFPQSGTRFRKHEKDTDINLTLRCWGKININETSIHSTGNATYIKGLLVSGPLVNIKLVLVGADTMPSRKLATTFLVQKFECT